MAANVPFAVDESGECYALGRKESWMLWLTIFLVMFIVAIGAAPFIWPEHISMTTAAWILAVLVIGVLAFERHQNRRMGDVFNLQFPLMTNEEDAD